MLQIIIILIVAIMVLLFKNERDSRRIKRLFAITTTTIHKAPITTFQKVDKAPIITTVDDKLAILDQASEGEVTNTPSLGQAGTLGQASGSLIRLCEEAMFRLLLRSEFVVDGSYVARPTRHVYHLGHLDGKDVFRNEFKADELDNLIIDVISDPKDIPDKLDSDPEQNIVVYYTRNFVEQYGDLELPIKYNLSSFSMPIPKDLDMTYEGKIYKRIHDDGKYVQLVSKRIGNDTIKYAPTSPVLEYPEQI